MSDTTITLRGRVGTDLAATRTKNGQMTVRFRLAVTNWFASADGVLTQGRTHWYTVRAWERLAENVFQSLRKGEPVIVVGRPTANAWIAKDDGLARSELVITAQSIGHDLANGRARYEKRERHWLERDNGDPSSGEVEAGELNAPPSPLEEVSPSLSSSPVQDAKFMRPALPGEDEVLCGTAQEESSPLLERGRRGRGAKRLCRSSIDFRKGRGRGSTGVPCGSQCRGDALRVKDQGV